MTRRLRLLLDTFKRLQGSPGSLARGTAVGVFIGFAPLIPLKTVFILTMTLLGRASTVAAMLVCTLICNPPTYLPLYYLAWMIGDLLLPGRADWATLSSTLNQMQQLGLVEAARLAGQVGFDTILVILVGGLVLALPPALLSYPLALRFFQRLERQRTKRHLQDNPEQRRQ